MLVKAECFLLHERMKEIMSVFNQNFINFLMFFVVIEKSFPDKINTVKRRRQNDL